MIALGVLLPDDQRVHGLVRGEVDQLIRERDAWGSPDAIEGVRREVLAMLDEGQRAAPVDLMVLSELRRRAEALRRRRVH